MIPKSIKWRLQIWYGLILVVVLAGFGGTAYQLERNRQFRRVDDALHRRFNFLVEALRRAHPPMRRQRPPLGQPPPHQFFAPGRPAYPPPQKFELPPQGAVFFDTNDPNGYYFLITGRNQRLVARRGNVPADDLTTNKVRATGNVPFMPHRRQSPPGTQTKGIYREISQRAPTGENIIVGCSTLPEQKELHRAAMNLTAVGILILLIGLAGGGWLVSRSLTPIASISEAAAGISAGDLSQRINVAETESELGRLAAILNSTFARLETAFAQQKQFVADAAHELRTPVSVILTQTQTTLTRERDAASYKQTVEACQRAAQRMRKLIESLLELARFDAGQEVLQRAHFDFSKMISDCVEMVQPLADERGVKIRAELAPLEIVGDAGRLGQVVTNLLTNAIQYNQPDGEVRLNLAGEAGLAVLTITDTGQGIEAQKLSRVFERFYRADASRTGGNAGLGLPICQAIVEAHGGIIDAASEAGVGTTFTVRLPA